MRFLSVCLLIFAPAGLALGWMQKITAEDRAASTSVVSAADSADTSVNEIVTRTTEEDVAIRVRVAATSFFDTGSSMSRAVFVSATYLKGGRVYLGESMQHVVLPSPSTMAMDVTASTLDLEIDSLGEGKPAKLVSYVVLVRPTSTWGEVKGTDDIDVSVRKRE